MTTRGFKLKSFCMSSRAHNRLDLATHTHTPLFCHVLCSSQDLSEGSKREAEQQAIPKKTARRARDVELGQGGVSEMTRESAFELMSDEKSE